MEISEAITKAVKGGWKNEHGFPSTPFWLLDTTFWQCLGKTKKWEIPGKEWLYHWHRLIDALASGKSIDEFFAGL